ncbi:MAG: hypothetical protein DCC73_12425 [Proteobacteria bacterium]|nr:MAG: hypothetical protein DCC73_12425 [Pseudomonadota bacterium]
MIKRRHMGGTRQRVLMSSAAMALAMTTVAANAQPVAQPVVEEVLVTGTRIMRSDLTSAAPISVLDEEVFAQKGLLSIADILQEIPQMSGSQTTAQTNNGGRGVSSINLRGLGSQRTLILVNGRRMVATDNLGTSLTVDLNNIPQAIIERVEVLRDGASAIYGSDAIGGVINIITKQDFEGLSINGQVGTSEEGDGEQYGADMTAGGKFADGRGKGWVNVSYYKTKPIYSKDRKFSAFPKDADLLDDGTVDVYSFGSSFTPTGTAFRLETGDAVVMDPDGEGFSPLSNDNRFNYSDYMYIFAPQERKTISGQVEYELMDNVSVYAEGLYVKRESQQQLAPPPLVVPNTVGFYVPADNPFNPFGEDVLLLRRLADVGAVRQYKQEVNTYRMVVGLKGEIDDRWNWDLSYMNGRNEVSANVFGLGRLDNINRGFLDPVGCAATPGCVPINLFGSNLSQDQLDAIRYTSFEHQTVQQDVGEFNITGNVFELPAGNVGLAAGAAWRRESYHDDVDSITESGASSDGERLSSSGHYDVKEIYGELSIPLVSKQDFAEYLGVDLAGRYSDYSTIGGVFSWKVGAQYAPTTDVRFRGVYSRAFRAPDALELFAGRKINFPTFQDPCESPASATVIANCIAQGVADPLDFEQRDSQVNTVEEGNADLSEEKAKTWTIGVVFTPSAVENLAITLDYYWISLKDAIDPVDAQTVLDQCLSSTDLSSPLCALIEPRDAVGQLTRILTPTANIGSFKTSGIDWSVLYGHKLGNSGAMQYNWSGTYLLKLEKVPFPGAPAVKYDGYTGGLNINANPHWRMNWSATYSEENWHLTYTGRFIGSSKSFTTRDNSTTGESVRSKISAYTYHDLQGGYRFNDNVQLVLGVRNIFDKKPPFFFDYEDNNSDPATYDMVGRFYYGAIRTNF